MYRCPILVCMYPFHPTSKNNKLYIHLDHLDKLFGMVSSNLAFENICDDDIFNLFLILFVPILHVSYIELIPAYFRHIYPAKYLETPKLMEFVSINLIFYVALFKPGNSLILRRLEICA